MRLVTVVGARPQFVKASAFAAELRRPANAGVVDHHLIHTGQHYDDEMSGVFFRELGIEPAAVNLDVGSGGHGEQTGEMMKRLEPVLVELVPDAVLLYGDTNSTLAAAIVAAKLDIPIAHVEAGLRSYRRAMPEEINRLVTDRLSTLLFCPSGDAADNLRKEGIVDGVAVVGDIMRDALDLQRQSSTAVPAAVGPGPFALATIHRAENTDVPERLAGIIDGLADLAASGLRVVLPLHPRTRGLVDVDRVVERGIVVIDPQSFAHMVALEAAAEVIITDSGGVQKEAFWLAVPCVTVRDETEWVETVDAGWNQLVPPERGAIVRAARRPAPAEPPPAVYGDGRAAAQILDRLRAAFG
jgi:UDP-GlcNAc3NAcA epimerase